MAIPLIPAIIIATPGAFGLFKKVTSIYVSDMILSRKKDGFRLGTERAVYEVNKVFSGFSSRKL